MPELMNSAQVTYVVIYLLQEVVGTGGLKPKDLITFPFSPPPFYPHVSRDIYRTAV